MATSFWTDFRRFFLRGLATVLPALLTIMLVVYVFKFVNNQFGNSINNWIIAIVAAFPKQDYDTLHEWWYGRWYLRAVGFVVTVVGVYFVGRFVASFIGRNVWRLFERAMLRTPLIKAIYPNIKQITDLLLSEDRAREYSRVVMVEYPRKGVWSMGLVTGTGLRSVSDPVGAEFMTVFVPSSPTPVTGYAIVVRRDEVIDTDITIDEAVRFVVSGGVLGPPAERIAATRKRLIEDHANMVLSPAAAADMERRPTEANEGTP